MRGAAAVVVGGPYYDYSPTTMKDGSLYKMWWCGGIAGDFILYSESYSLDSGWSPYQIALMPSNQPGAFDSLLTCDPSVVRVNGTYYLYYGGAGGAAPGQAGTAIFLATSTNGINFTRANGGAPIVSAAQPNSPGEYGAGQPTVTYVNGWFYMRFTDTTGLGNVHPDNDGQYLIRSQDPTFQSGVEAFRGPGVFSYSTQANHTLNRFWPEHFAGFSAEMIYIDATDQFAFPGGAPGPGGITKVELYNSSFSRKEGEFYITVPAQTDETWWDAPTFVSTPDRHALTTGTCGVLAMDIMRSYGSSVSPSPDPFYGSGIAHVGADWVTGLTCDCVSAPTPNQPGYCAVGDFNGDNLDDLTSHHRATGAFTIRANNGAGGFAPDGVFTATGSTPPSSWGYETLIGDFDGDNWTDYADRHIASGQVWVHRNLHNGTFDSGTWAFGYTMTGPNIEILTGDLSGDGKADLIEHNKKTGQLWVRVNTGQFGTFAPADVDITYRSQAGSLGNEWRLIAADFTGDGTVDMADYHVPSSQFWVHPAIGGYQFSPTSWNVVQAFNWSGFTTVFGDFNGDGKADYGDVNTPFGDIWVHTWQPGNTFDPGNYAYGVYSLGSGGRSILGVPVNFP